MIRMTNKAREAAKSLAVAYQAYMEAATHRGMDTLEREAHRLNVILVWGRKLREAQSETGIELHADQHIEGRMTIARSKLAEMDPGMANGRFARIIEGCRRELRA